MSQEQALPPQKETLEVRQSLVRDIKRSISNAIDTQFDQFDASNLSLELGKTERVDTVVGVWEGDYVQLLRTRKNIGLDSYFEIFEVAQLIPTVNGGDHTTVFHFLLDEEHGAVKTRTVKERHSDGAGPHAQLTGTDKEQLVTRQDRLYELLRIITNLAIVPNDEADKILAKHSKAIPLVHQTEFDKKQAEKKQLRGRGVRNFIRKLLDKNDLSGEQV